MNKKVTGRAIRPIFVPGELDEIFITEKDIEFDWHLGMSAEVRKRSIVSMHKEAAKLGFTNVLEASSKSSNSLGIALSAFFLKNKNGVPVENIFQSSKVFIQGGPFRDLLTVTPREAKRDERLKTHGDMIHFLFNGKEYPLLPRSFFYDWLYLQVFMSEQNSSLRSTFIEADFQAFTDIEFNPKKSFSCQARTLALISTLIKNNIHYDFINNPIEFLDKFDIYNMPKSISNQKENIIQRQLF